MKTDLQNIIKLLLNLHKALLDLERIEYEAKNGQISSNNEYFQLVVNHENFRWLRVLSELIALFDEEIERAEINQEKIRALLDKFKSLLQDNFYLEFFNRYQYFLGRDEKIRNLGNQITNYIADLK